MRWPFAGLPAMSYDLIMSDPPWRFTTYSDKGRDRSADSHYRTMTFDQLQALPVAMLAKPDCLLWLWATHPMIDQQIHLMRVWGFRFVTSGVWVKRTANGGLAFGTGYRLRSASEPFLLGVIGNPATTKSVRTVVEGKVREHSRKPEEAYAAAEALMPGARRADLFSRQRRPGWDAWGLETDKFMEVTDGSQDLIPADAS